MTTEIKMEMIQNMIDKLKKISPHYNYEWEINMTLENCLKNLSILVSCEINKPAEPRQSPCESDDDSEADCPCEFCGENYNYCDCDCGAGPLCDKVGCDKLGRIGTMSGMMFCVNHSKDYNDKIKEIDIQNECDNECEKCKSLLNMETDSVYVLDKPDEQIMVCINCFNDVDWRGDGWECEDYEEPDEYMDELMDCVVCERTDIPRKLLHFNTCGSYTDTCEECFTLNH